MYYIHEPSGLFYDIRNPMNAIIRYVNESIRELELVRWPTRQQAVRLSAIVLIFTAINALAFGAIDIALTNGLYFLTTTL